MRGKKTIIYALLLGGFLAEMGFCQQSFSKGEEFFMQNRPAEAAPFLEAALSEDPAHVKAGIYLAVAYTQLKRLDDAIAVYRKILPRGGAETARIAFNLGNAYYSKGDINLARQYYTQAIEVDPSYAPAYLNRANTLVRAGAPLEALPDYNSYLSLEPRSGKREMIENLVTFIEEEQAAAERQRIAAEAAAKAEEERRKKLLEEVAASLQAAADESQGLSSGKEEVEGYDGEFELE